jgi:hypothetical protein
MSDEAAITEPVFTEAEAQAPPDPQEDGDAFFSRQQVLRRAVPLPEETPAKPADWAAKVGRSGAVDYLEDLRTRQAQAYRNDPLRHEKDAAAELKGTVLWDSAVTAAGLQARAADLVEERLRPAKDEHAAGETEKKVAGIWSKISAVENVQIKAQERVTEADKSYQEAKGNADLDGMREAATKKLHAAEDVKTCDDLVTDLKGHLRVAEDASQEEKFRLIHSAAEALQSEVDQQRAEALERLGVLLKEIIPALAFPALVRDALRGR